MNVHQYGRPSRESGGAAPTKNITTRLTDKELAKLERSARKAKQPRAVLVREALKAAGYI